MNEPMPMPRNCANCAHWDGDCYCALPREDSPIPGFVAHPTLVVCAKHTLKAADDAEGVAV